ARDEILAWATLGQVAPPRTVAPVSSDRSTEATVHENAAAPAEMAPAPPVAAAPTVEAPAAPTAVVRAAPAPASMHITSRRRRSTTDGPRATAAKPRAAKDDADDLYR